MLKKILNKIKIKIFNLFDKIIRKLTSVYQVKLNNLELTLQYMISKNEDVKIQNGKILSILNQQKQKEILNNIQLAEFKVFSQWDDDGIIQFLVNYLDIKEKSFIEFGVENYVESNTRFLLMNNNWKGLIIDGSKNYMDHVRNSELYWRYNLTAVDQFVTKENVNQIFEENNFKGEIGLLHIDIDGNDYWVWKEIKVVSPVIVIVEYNSVYGADKPWTVPYKHDFYRTDFHYSNLSFGTSLLSICDLAKEKGYKFIGSNSAGNNAYFIRADKMKDLKEISAKEGYVVSLFRESRNEQGHLTYLNDTRLSVINGTEIFNTRTNKIEKI